MFRTLESTWDNSTHRGWTAIASFTMQVAGMGLLLLIPMLTNQEPPIVRWLKPTVLTPPPGPAPTERVERPTTPSNFREGHLQEPQFIPNTITNMSELPVASAPDLDSVRVPGGTNRRGHGVIDSVGPSVDVAAPPPASSPTHPLKISHWAEGNVIYRVQPQYPSLARQARIQGSVELRAIISKAGTIENLIVVSGHPMLTRSAIDAVRQWRYRPYLLNNETIAVETEITVNFMLSGG